MNDMADDTWDNKPVNRTSAIHFLDDDDDDEDDEKVRAAILKTQRGADFGLMKRLKLTVPCIQMSVLPLFVNEVHIRDTTMKSCF